MKTCSLAALEALALDADRQGPPAPEDRPGRHSPTWRRRPKSTLAGKRSAKTPIGKAHAIKIDALARLGELLAEMPKATGTRGQLDGRDPSGGYRKEPPEQRPTLAAVLGQDKAAAKNSADRVATRGAAGPDAGGDRGPRDDAHRSAAAYHARRAAGRRAPGRAISRALCRSAMAVPRHTGRAWGRPARQSRREDAAARRAHRRGLRRAARGASRPGTDPARGPEGHDRNQLATPTG